jgi:hypothetical protein
MKIDVKHFGATGDGKADDCFPIQDAINSARPGDEVFFPDGDYTLHYAGDSAEANISENGVFRLQDPPIEVSLYLAN